MLFPLLGPLSDAADAKRDVVFTLFLTFTIAIEHLAMSAFTHPASLFRFDQLTSPSTPALREGAITHSAEELGRNGQVGLLETDQVESKVIPNSFHKKLSDFKEDDLSLIFFSGPDAEPRMQRLKLTREIINSIARTRSKQLKSGLASPATNQEKILHDEEETEHLLHALRGRLSVIFDEQKSKLGEFLWRLNAKKHLPANARAVWEVIMQSEQDAHRFRGKSHGFFGRFYSLWKYLFDNQNWQNQRLDRALRRIRIELRNRPPTSQERIVLQLEKIQKAGFLITQKEQRLAQKISKFSQVATNRKRIYMSLSSAEENLLKEMARRTVPVRRTEQIEHIVKQLPKTPNGAEFFRNHPQDLQLIASALKELATKEREGKVWTQMEVDLLAALKLESKGGGKKTSKLDQILRNLKKQKALEVLDVQAYSPMIERQALHSKLKNKHSVYTDAEMTEVTQLAEQYYRLKEQADTPVHPNLIHTATEQLHNEALSKEERAILFLEEKKERTGIHASQRRLLRKLKQLKEGDPPVTIPEEANKWVQEHLKIVTQIPDRSKAKQFEEALSKTPELMPVQGMHELKKAQFYDEVVYSRPAFEWWAEKSSETTDNTQILEGHREDLVPAERYLTFPERCQVLVLSNTFRVSPNRQLPSVESLALSRLDALTTLKDLSQQEMKLRDGLSRKDFEMINSPSGKQMIESLAIEETLLKICKATRADQKLVIRLAQNIQIGDLDESARQKLGHLLPAELETLGHLISLQDDDHEFREASKFSRIMELIIRASDRITLAPKLSENDELINFLVSDAQKPRILKLPPAEERRVLNYLHAILDQPLASKNS
ncbi:uncharacterized protein PGTG_14907 [Puccinia graminis f. sp. tritici CRL 75-36-700-3]|uniref:Uncharacterized protein n=1 Tax=Puccinia graminis f. sp. tritici (strain CRL 75-36-700-3 / race SCCL) TaxID=418459 RepID=E3KXK4_PUCGT|nr:uncharacterized protein PGTG_14907 [Puccinia graminis f. sp. tritici CRL 75-36-700-3]EFP89066.1 hypothetical protein PGTG_14907 [Puccinia graminis f. sp. tritici CRL 75-36-700-3]